MKRAPIYLLPLTALILLVGCSAEISGGNITEDTAENISVTDEAVSNPCQWIQSPSPDPADSVRITLENEADKEYTVSMSVSSVTVDEDETARVANNYKGSELAEYRGWTDELLDNDFVVVKADYFCEYDHTKTFLEDGHAEQYFYLIHDTSADGWVIVDNSSPNIIG